MQRRNHSKFSLSSNRCGTEEAVVENGNILVTRDRSYKKVSRISIDLIVVQGDFICRYVICADR
jgi:hypothetical protein